ncbi:MAG: hypothetical protein JXQ29_10170 [Planctomycetes bacterium]|nr:hypothetical protein [Planctomycetota bacterium]
MSRTLAAIALVLLAAPAAAQVAVREEAPGVPARLIGGRLFTRAELRAGEKKVPAHLLLELGRASALVLHERTAALLELEPGGSLDLEFADYRAAAITPAVSRLRFLEYLTAEYARELEEIPVVGILGAGAFGGARLRLDYEKATLAILPPREVDTEALPPPVAAPAEPEPPNGAERAAEPTHPAAAPPLTSVPMTIAGGAYRVQVELDGSRTAIAAPATGEPDTWIAANLAAELGHPGGDLGSAHLGALDIAHYVALRPGAAPEGFPGAPDLLLGNNLLAHFIVTLDPHLRRLELEAVREPDFPAEEQACFQALVARDAAALEAFLDEHHEHRLAADAGQVLLEIRLGATPLDATALETAVNHFARTRPPKRRSRVMLDLLKQLVVRQPEAYRLVRQTALDIALASARLDEDPGAVHRARSEIGAVLLEQDQVSEAYRHLLSAAFGLPQDGLINLRLGQLYEKKGQEERAWSRYLQAAITEEAGAQGMAGLKRLADKKGIRTPYDVDEMEKLLEGRVPAFQPASRHEPPGGARPTRTVLAELFTGAHCRPCAAADLAFDGLVAHFAAGEVAILQHHLHVPAAEPLVSPAATIRAQHLGVRGAPAVVLDGRVPVPEVGGPPESAARAFRLVRAAVEERLAEPTPWTIALEGRIDGERLTVTARIDGPEAEDHRLRLYLAERTVLFPGANKIVLHRYVTRFEIARGGAALARAAGERVVERVVSLAGVEDQLEEHLDAVEIQTQREFSMRPTRPEPRQLAVVAFVEDGRGHVAQAAMWSAVPPERE